MSKTSDRPFTELEPGGTLVLYQDMSQKSVLKFSVATVLNRVRTNFDDIW